MVHSCVTLGLILLALSPAESIYAHEGPENHHTGERRNTLMNIQHAVEITVMNREGVRLSDAKVTVQPAGSAAPVPANYDAGRQIYYADVAHIPHIVIEVSHAEYESEKRIVRIQSAHQESLFVLGKKGDAFAYVGQGKMPYMPRPELVGFVVAIPNGSQPLPADELRKKLAAEIDLPADSIELFSSGGSESQMEHGVVHVRRSGAEVETRERKEIIRKLRGSSLIQQAGPVYRIEDQAQVRGRISLQFLTNMLLVQFMPEVNEQEIQALLKDLGITVHRFYSSSDLYVVRADDSADEDINLVIEKLLNSGRVYGVTVELGGLIEHDGN